MKGSPGSGRTAFTLTLLRLLSKNGNGLYLSTRVDSDKLYEFFPWVKETIPPSSVIDAMSSRLPKDSSRVGHLRYRTMPEFFEALYAKVSEMENAIVLVDSWDAVLQTVKDVSAADLEGMILDFASETTSRLVLVTETLGETQLDYMVDGIVELGFVDNGQEVNRYLQIRKLRGSPHDLRKYLLMINDDGLEVKGLLYE